MLNTFSSWIDFSVLNFVTFEIVGNKGKRANLKTGVWRKQSMSNFSKKQIFLTSWYAQVLCFLETPVLIFALLPYYRRNIIFEALNSGMKIFLRDVSGVCLGPSQTAKVEFFEKQLMAFSVTFHPSIRVFFTDITERVSQLLNWLLLQMIIINVVLKAHLDN